MLIPLHARQDEAATSECAQGKTCDGFPTDVPVSDKNVARFGIGITFAIIFLCIFVAVLWFQPWRRWKCGAAKREEQSPFMGDQSAAAEMQEHKQPEQRELELSEQPAEHHFQRKPVPLQRRLTIKLPRHVSAARRSKTPEDQLTSLDPDPLDDLHRMSTPDEALIHDY
ncbi:hypothetical protein BDV06DRAFT_225324 [Aspergillus oleicola]